MSSAKFYENWQQPSAQNTRFQHVQPHVSKEPNASFVFSGDGMGALATAHEFAKFWVIPYTDHTVVHAIDRVRPAHLTGSGPVPNPDEEPALVPAVSATEELNRYGTELLNLGGPGQPLQSQVNEIAAQLGFAVPRER